MELVSPGIGLIFWMSLAFGLVLFVLGKYAWKPILKALKEREQSIDDALHAADKAREEMQQLKFDNEKLLAEAKEERDVILREARKLREKLLEDSRLKANEEANRILDAARESIENEKMAALTELKNQLASLSIEIAEKILKQRLADDPRQQALVETLMKDVRFN
ncbi:MAG TPA: F0F1 ATP synthase subunit B [Bacteroidales bacterium]|nr:F0F1 ATP synthase subunit B [Bacteroidales bacterium]HRZ76141.1 F0F1 ATP synthase subunit B [Bacteroidales bacterium]